MIYIASDFLYHFYASVNLFCRKHDYDSYCSLDLSLPSLLLAFTCTERERCSCFQTPENQVVPKVSTINTYAWHFKPFQVNSHALPLKPSKCFPICVYVSVLMRKYVVFSFQPYHLLLMDSHMD